MPTRRLFFILVSLVMLAGCSAAEEEVATAVTPAVETAATAAPLAPEPTATEMPPTATEIPPTPQATQTAVTADVQIVKDVLYATAVDPDAEDQLLDVYYLPESNAAKPVVIFAHGSSLDKSSAFIFGRLLAKEGYVVLPIDWRDEITGNKDPAYLREAMEDVQCALRAAAEQGELYGADPQQVIWTGFSAGAWIGSMISLGEGDLQAVMDDYASTHGGPAQRVTCTAEAPPAKITAFLPGAGAFPGDFWLGNGVNPEWTPVFALVREFTVLGHNPDLKIRILHGKQDYSYDTRFEDAETFSGALQEAGYDAVLLPQDGSHQPFQQAIIDEVLALDGR